MLKRLVRDAHTIDELRLAYVLHWFGERGVRLAVQGGQLAVHSAGRLDPTVTVGWLEDNAAEVAALLTRYNAEFALCMGVRDDLPPSLRGPIEKAHEAHALANLCLPALTEL